MTHTEETIEKFREVFELSKDILNDEGAGSFGKVSMVGKELEAFLSSALSSQSDRIIAMMTFTRDELQEAQNIYYEPSRQGAIHSLSDGIQAIKKGEY